MSVSDQLTRREQQIMMILFRNGTATAKEIGTELPDPPSNATVRKLLSLMEEKRLIRHTRRGASFVYQPLKDPEKASKEAMEKTVNTFYQDSPPRAFAALLDTTRDKLSEKDIEELQSMIDSVRKEEKNR